MAWRGFSLTTGANMLEIQVWVEGVTALLQHRATEESLMGEHRANTPVERADPRDVCEKALYRLMPSRQIAVPGAAFARMVREAGGSHKAKGSRKSLKYLVPSAVLVLDDLCGLYLRDRKTPIKDFEVDSRPVVIPSTKGRVIRHRARFNEWSCKIHLRINDSILDEKTVRMLFSEGLQQIGIGDFRPERGGPFGVSSLTEWKLLGEERDLTPAQRRNSGRRPDPELRVE
jgi:hypothetical protein